VLKRGPATAGDVFVLGHQTRCRLHNSFWVYSHTYIPVVLLVDKENLST
jgi:hypothetical protein